MGHSVFSFIRKLLVVDIRFVSDATWKGPLVRCWRSSHNQNDAELCLAAHPDARIDIHARSEPLCECGMFGPASAWRADSNQTKQTGLTLINSIQAHVNTVNTVSKFKKTRAGAFGDLSTSVLRAAPEGGP
jgi:hypothetical protein